MSPIVTVSSKGQITLPMAQRKKSPYKKYLLENQGINLILKPIEIRGIEESKETGKLDIDKDFHKLANDSFSFWNNSEDTAQEEFYKALPDISR